MGRISLTVSGDPKTVYGVTLEDSAAPTYGIKRDSDNAVIVAAGEVVTINVGNVWTYETSLLDPLTDYTVAFKVTFSATEDIDGNPLPDGGSQYAFAHIIGIKSQTTLRFLRRKLAQELGGFDLAMTTTTAPDASSSITASLIDRSDNVAALHNSAYVYACTGSNAGIQKKVQNDSFVGSSGFVSYTSDWPNTMLENVELEFHQKMGAITAGKMIGIRECINSALEVLWTVDRVPFPTVTPSDDGLSRDLNEIDWLRQKNQIIGVIDNTGFSPGIFYTPQIYTFQYDAERPSLSGPQPLDTSTFSLAVYRPLNTWIKRDGVWTESISGLVNDTDECLGDYVLIVQVALYFVYRAMAENPYEGQQARDRWEAKANRQAIIAKNIKMQNLPQNVEVPGYNRLPTPGYKGLLGW